VNFLKEVKEKKGKIKSAESAVVIGGGEVAMDASLTLKKLGVKTVTDFAYEKFEYFKASKDELLKAREAGVTILDGYIPVKATKAGVCTFTHRIIDSKVQIKAPLIILAIGQTYELDNLGLSIEDFNSSDCRIKNTNLFFAGDLAPLDKNVVYAVRSAKEVTNRIIDFLKEGK
jgi:dihydropyrimidine dehydrogenase (NAD+) subunit PreT